MQQSYVISGRDWNDTSWLQTGKSSTINWKRYKVTAFYNVLSTYLALFSCLQVTSVFCQLTRLLLMRTRKMNLLLMSLRGVLPSCWRICIVQPGAITPQANLMTPLNPGAHFPPRLLRGAVPHLSTTWGLMSTTFQPSKQGYLCVKKMSSGSWPLLVSFSKNHCNSPWNSRLHHLLLTLRSFPAAFSIIFFLPLGAVSKQRSRTFYSSPFIANSLMGRIFSTNRHIGYFPTLKKIFFYQSL